MWPIIVLSALAGAACGAFLRGRAAVLWGCAIPWLGVLAWLLYNEFFVAYDGGGASMWPVALLIAGTVAALVGGVAAAAVGAARRRMEGGAPA